MGKELQDQSNSIESAWHLFDVAEEFREAQWLLIGKFDVIANEWPKSVERPAYFCSGLSLENYFKSYFELSGNSYPKNGADGHDLEGLLKIYDSIDNFFELNAQEKEAIRLLNKRYFRSEEYGSYDLRYTKRAGIRLSPHPDVLSFILRKMGSKLNEQFLLATPKPH